MPRSSDTVTNRIEDDENSWKGLRWIMPRNFAADMNACGGLCLVYLSQLQSFSRGIDPNIHCL